jgi:hypothetical protein
VLGSTINVLLGNSAGAPTAGVLLVGVAPTSLATGFGGTLLVVPSVTLPVGLPAAGLTFGLAVPATRSLCGRSVYLQGAEADAGASHGVSFSRGLDLMLGQ